MIFWWVLAISGGVLSAWGISKLLDEGKGLGILIFFLILLIGFGISSNTSKIDKICQYKEIVGTINTKLLDNHQILYLDENNKYQVYDISDNKISIRNVHGDYYFEYKKTKHYNDVWYKFKLEDINTEINVSIE